MLGYNPERQRELMAWLGMPGADWLELTSTLFALLGVFVLGLFAWMLRRFARPDPVQAAWNLFCRKLGARGVARAPHEGPLRLFRARRARPAVRRRADPPHRRALHRAALRQGGFARAAW